MLDLIRKLSSAIKSRPAPPAAQPVVTPIEKAAAAPAPYPIQYAPVLAETRRRYVDQPPSFTDLESNDIHTIVAHKARDVALKPFSLIDPDDATATIVKSYAPGRTIHVPVQTVSFAKNVRVTGTGVILTEDGQIFPESSIREHHAYYTSDKKSVEIRDTNLSENIVKRVSEPVIILIGVFPLHFSHWLYDNFARLNEAKRVLGDLSSYKIAVGFGQRRGGWCKPTSFQYECLSFLGIPHENVIMLPEREWMQFDNAVILSENNNFKPPTENIWNAPEIFDFFSQVYDAAGLPREKPHRRVHLSRTDDMNRKCMNEPDVVSFCTEHGFEDKVIAGMSMVEQMRYFSEIEIACGPAGNNLLTMCFMQPGTKIVTYFPPQASHIIAYYQSFCSALGVDLYAICGGKTWSGTGTDKLDDLRWEVDLKSVKETVSALIAST